MAAWPHGFVHIKLLGDLSATATALDGARHAARYLAKYVVKGLGPGGGASPQGRRAEALHRYEVAQGYQPRTVLLGGRTADEALDRAAAIMGREPTKLWYSVEAERWSGPAAVWASWDGVRRRDAGAPGAGLGGADLRRQGLPPLVTDRETLLRIGTLLSRQPLG